MAFLEWRKFNFFDLKKGVDDGTLAKLFKDNEIVVASSGNNHLVIGDSSGHIHLISRSWQVTSFKAYDIKLNLIQQFRNSPLLVTVGSDEIGVNPLIKVWDTSRMDKSGAPYCARITRAIPNNHPVPVSVLCVHENTQLMAIGFVDGSLVLYRGDITRERGSRQKILRDTSSPVTGLAFKTSANVILLFVSTDSSVCVYNITRKDKEVMSRLDNIGCSKKCSVIAESTQESHFMIAKNDAIYCYTSDGRGPCYAVDGEKVMLQWFRSYLIIVSKTNRITPTASSPSSSQLQNGHLLTVLDIQNKFIVFSSPLSEVKAILNEWGGFYIIDDSNNIYHLNEKDLQSKLSLLFKKNLYDIAIRIAKLQQYDSDGLIDIFRQYGDHLYGKGDHSGAIEQYVKTIGKLEPSYVIRKFLDSKHIDKLTSYLQSLHKQGQATEDHTTLLLNCFTKLNKTENLKEFILQKDRDLDFDVDIAIKVCRQGSPEEALMLARKHAKHDWYIKLQLEDHRMYGEIINYISGLDFGNAELYGKKYGKVLIENAPVESTRFLKQLCTDFGTEHQKADAEDYIHLFLNHSTELVEFLDHLIQAGCFLSSPVYDTLLEHYLHVWGQWDDGPERNGYEQKALKLLQNADVKYNKHQALVVCHMHGFSKGILYLYEEQKLYQQILRYHMSRKDVNQVLACCRCFGHQEPTLWVQALWSCVRDPENSLQDLLPEVLSRVAGERLLSPQLVIEAIGTGKAEIQLSHIRSYVVNELKKEAEITTSDTVLTEKYQRDTEVLKEQLETLKNGAILIQGSRCAACHHPLELPSLHFLCRHSYHQHCFQSYSENENECLACQPRNKEVLELLKAREHNKDLHETFHSQLEKASDSFTLAAEYFRRGVFNTVKVITDKPNEKKPVEKFTTEQKKYIKPKEQTKETATYGTGAEARLRQTENKRSSPALIPTSEGRIRANENRRERTNAGDGRFSDNRFSSSLEGNITIPKNAASASSRPFVKREVKLGGTPKSLVASSNPFEDDDEDDYDEKKNPFADSPPDEPGKDDDYDKNLNPFNS